MTEASACRPRVVECLLTLRRIYETEMDDNAKNPRRPFILSPRQSTPDVSGHQPFKLSGRQSTPGAATPEFNYQAVQQVPQPALPYSLVVKGLFSSCHLTAVLCSIFALALWRKGCLEEELGGLP